MNTGMTRWYDLDAGALAREAPSLIDWPFGRRVEFFRIQSGTTNINWRMEAQGRTYFLKVPGKGSDSFVNPSVACEAAQVAADAGVGPAVLYFDQVTGIQVTEFLQGYRSAAEPDITSRDGSHEVMRIYRKLHAGSLLSTTKTLFDMIDEHLSQVAETGRALQPYQRDVQEQWLPIQERYKEAGLDLVPGHNDPNPPNFMLKDGQGMMLVDFDYAANTDRYYELGTYMTLFNQTEDRVRELFRQYSGEPTDGQMARLYLSGVGALVKWGHWALYNSIIRDIDFDYERYGSSMLLGAHTRLRSKRCREALEAL